VHSAISMERTSPLMFKNSPPSDSIVVGASSWRLTDVGQVLGKAVGVLAVNPFRICTCADVSQMRFHAWNNKSNTFCLGFIQQQPAWACEHRRCGHVAKGCLPDERGWLPLGGSDLTRESSGLQHSRWMQKYG